MAVRPRSGPWIHPRPRPRTSGERIEPAAAFGTRRDATSTLSQRQLPGPGGRIRRNRTGFDAYQSGETILGGSGTMGERGTMGGLRGFRAAALVSPKLRPPTAKRRVERLRAEGPRHDAGSTLGSRPHPELSRVDPGRRRQIRCVPVSRSAFGSERHVGSRTPDPAAATRRVTAARRSGRTAHCTNPFGTGPTEVATR